MRNISNMKSFVLGLAIGAAALSIYMANKLIDEKKRRQFYEELE